MDRNSQEKLLQELLGLEQRAQRPLGFQLCPVYAGGRGRWWQQGAEAGEVGQGVEAEAEELE